MCCPVAVLFYDIRRAGRHAVVYWHNYKGFRFFSEVGSTTQISELRVGKTYSVHFSPYSAQLFEKYKDFISGSVEKVTYYLDVPYKGVGIIGSSTTAPFIVQYTPTDVGQCILTASFDLSPKDNNKWVEVESVVNVIAAE